MTKNEFTNNLIYEKYETYLRIYNAVEKDGRDEE